MPRFRRRRQHCAGARSAKAHPRARCTPTGLISHLIQHPPGWFGWPAGPDWLYRVTEGLHVAVGLAAIPLFLVKLWTVYPKLFEWPAASSVATAISRVSILVLVGAAAMQLLTGLINISEWYPFGFSFTVAHCWTGSISIGAVAVHVGANGNVGIGGNPAVLLARCRELLQPAGRVLVELDPTGSGLITNRLRLERGTESSSWFDWAHVGAEAVDGPTGEAGAARRPALGEGRPVVRDSAASWHTDDGVGSCRPGRRFLIPITTESGP